MTKPRIALLGMSQEGNRFAPPAGEADFRSLYWYEGAEILEAARAPGSKVAHEVSGFVAMMDATGPWEPVPLILTACFPAGPVDGDLVRAFCARVAAELDAAGPLDGIYIANHGAMLASDDHDPDGAIFAAVRAAAGPDCRIVATLDLHGNISERMVEASDLIVGYRTNPHVDMLERGEEAAVALRRMLAGQASPEAAFIRLPIAPPSVTLLTAEGPYAELIALGQRRQAELGGQILNVSVFGNFILSDTPKNGIGIVVTGRDALAPACRLAREIAERAWAERHRYSRALTSEADAIGLARHGHRAPVIFSDAGDNPGGGGSGRTTAFLERLIAADVKNLLYGSFHDPELAAEAHAAGPGTRFTARFNRSPTTAYDHPLEAEAEVIALSDGAVIGRLGLYKDRALALGRSAALKIGGLTVVVISARSQTADPMFFEMLDLDIARAHTVVVKSRGHFRAGFAPWFPPERVYEVDSEGVTSPVLSRFDWQHLPRPVYPLDQDTEWTPPW